MRTRIQVETSFFMNEEFNPSSFNHEEQYLKKRFEDFTADMSIEDIIRLKFGDDMVSRFLSVL